MEFIFRLKWVPGHKYMPLKSPLLWCVKLHDPAKQITQGFFKPYLKWKPSVRAVKSFPRKRQTKEAFF